MCSNNDGLTVVVMDLMPVCTSNDGVEEELYPDTPTPIYVNEYKEAQMAALDTLVDLQECMGKGMRLIQKANATISKFFKENRWMGSLYVAWRARREGKELTGKQKRFLSDRRNVNKIKWLDYRARCWDGWHSLKDQGCKLAEAMNLWPLYFELCDTEFTRYWTYGDTQDVDNMTEMNNPLGTIECLAWEHVQEQKEWDKVDLADDQFDWIPFEEYKRQEKDREMQSLLSWVDNMYIE